MSLGPWTTQPEEDLSQLVKPREMDTAMGWEAVLATTEQRPWAWTLHPGPSPPSAPAVAASPQQHHSYGPLVSDCAPSAQATRGCGAAFPFTPGQQDPVRGAVYGGEPQAGPLGLYI